MAFAEQLFCIFNRHGADWVAEGEGEHASPRSQAVVRAVTQIEARAASRCKPTPPTGYSGSELASSLFRGHRRNHPPQS